MMKIIFKRVIIEGFGSILKPLEINLDTQHIVRIGGRNGSGKTTIFSAINWALYKETLKKGSSVSPWESIITDKFKGTKVLVDFEKEGDTYTVIRMKGYKGKIDGYKGGNRVILYKNGTPIPIRDKNDINQNIIDIIGMSSDLFKHSIIMGQKLSRISSESGPKRKELFTEIFETGFINRAKDTAVKKLSKLQEEYSKNVVKLNILKTNKEGKAELLDTLEDMRDNFQTTKVKDIEDVKLKIANKKTLISDVRKRLQNDKKPMKPIKPKTFDNQDIEDIKVEISELKTKRENDKKFRDRLTREITELYEEVKLVKDVCDVCGSTLDTKGNKKRREKLTSEAESKAGKQIEVMDRLNSMMTKIDIKKIELKNLKKKRSAYTNNLEAYESAMENYNNHDKYLDGLKQSKSDLIKDINNLNEEVKKLKASEFTNHNKINTTRNEINNLREQIKTIKTINLKLKIQINRLNWVISEPLSNKGLSTFIFDQMIGQLNKKLMYYSQFIGFRVEFYIADNKKRDIEINVKVGSDSVPINDLSGGQKQLIDTAIIFSINNVVSSNVNVNMLLLDEIFESLDPDNVEIISNLISEKSKDRCIFMITHLQEFNLQNVEELRLGLRDGITEIL